jgi:hypothetical protein
VLLEEADARSTRSVALVHPQPHDRAADAGAHDGPSLVAALRVQVPVGHGHALAAAGHRADDRVGGVDEAEVARLDGLVRDDLPLAVDAVPDRAHAREAAVEVVEDVAEQRGGVGDLLPEERELFGDLLGQLRLVALGSAVRSGAPATASLRVRSCEPTW